MRVDTQTTRLVVLVVAVVTAGVLTAGSSGQRGWDSVGAVVNIDVKLDRGRAAGTGIVISSTGLVITANHVIRGARTVRAVDVGNGKAYPATVLGSSITADIAVLRLRAASGLKTAPLAAGSILKREQRVTAFGNEGGLGGAPSVEPGRIIASTGPPAAYGLGFYKGTKGALVVAIAPHSTAAVAGLSAGDVITSFGGKEIRTPTDFKSALLRVSPKERVALAWVDEFGRTDGAKGRSHIRPA